MEQLRRHIREAANASPPEARAAIYAIGAALERLFRDVQEQEREISANLRELRETLDPLVYDRVIELAAGLSLELAEAYARLADVELRAGISQAEREALRAGLDAAATDRAELRAMLGALAEDLATLRGVVETCCGGGPQVRAVGE